jgi:hypothetical protein
MDNWYSFDSIESFNAWHEALKAELGYPLPSIDQDGNIVGEPYSTEYTSAVKVSDNDFRAIVEDQYSDGLILSEKPFFEDKMMDGSDEANTL